MVKSIKKRLRNFLLIASLLVFVNVLFSELLSDDKPHYKKENDISMNLSYHKPEYLLKNSINSYSIIHFIEYFLLSLLPFIKLVHIVFISITWEVLELFIPSDWARESWANKVCDLVFNFFGFYFSKKLFYK